MNISNPTEILLIIIAVGIIGVGLLMFTVLLVAVYAGRLIGRLEQPFKVMGEKLDKVSGSLDRFVEATATDFGALAKRVEALEHTGV